MFDTRRRIGRVRQRRRSRNGPPLGSSLPPTPRPSYVPSLDGLRAIAVGAVVAYHLRYLSGGYLGVDLFFVVSGYLITSLLIDEAGRTGRVSLGAFWRHRFRRLMPAALVAVVATMVATRWWEPSWRWYPIRADALATLLYVQNWHQITSGQSYFDGASPFRHTWSLSIEEQFYFLWPIVVLAVVTVAKGRARVAVGAVAAVGAVVSATAMAVLARGNPGPAQLSRIYLGTGTRAMAVLAGAVLAASVVALRRVSGTSRRRWQPVAAVIAVPALLAVITMIRLAGNLDIRMYRGGFALFAALSAFVVLGCVAAVGPVAWVCSLRPLRWIGRISYAIYLWSWPVQVFAEDEFGLAGARLVLMVIAVTIVLSVLTTVLVERPVRYGDLFRGRVWLGPAAVATAAALVVVLSLGAMPTPDYASVSDDQAVSGVLRPASPDGPASDPPHVMVTGDSVAWSMAWDLSGAEMRDVRVDLRAIIACGVMPPGTRWITAARAAPQAYPPSCAHQAAADRAGLAGRPDVVVFSVGAWETYDQLQGTTRLVAVSERYRAVLIDRLGSKIAEFRRTGAHVIVPLVPCAGEMRASLGPERHDEHKRAWFNDILRDLASRFGEGMSIVDPTPLLCHPDGTAISHVDGVPTGVPRPDGIHYTRQARPWLWRELLIPAVRRAVGEHHRPH